MTQTSPKAAVFGAFRPFSLGRRQPAGGKEDQKSLETTSLWGRRFLKERIFGQPRQKRSEYCRIREYFIDG